MMSRCIALAILSCGISALSAQSTAAPKVLDFPRFKLVPGNVDTDGTPTSGAQLCLLPHADTCYRLPPEPYSKESKELYQFGLEPRSERLSIRGGGSLIFFSGQFSGGGSGTLNRLAILRYEPNGTISNLLPYVAVTNQSERAMWTLPDLSALPILVTADFVWGSGANEYHFSPHFYELRAFRFDSSKDRYMEILDYKTTKRYPGLDDRERIKVLAPEREEILRRLKNLR